MSQSVPPRITRSYLENAALHYLERFSSSSANLRRVLVRKVNRSLAHWGDDGRALALADIDAVLEGLTRLGYLDDARYALSKAAGLRAKGRPERAVRAELAAKGVDGEGIDNALEELSERGDGGDWAAALVFCRRRKIGPYRSGERGPFRQKDLAALARAGFGWSVASRVIDLDDPDYCTR